MHHHLNADGGVKLLDLHFKVTGGGRHIGVFESKEKDGSEKRFGLYQPGYDENGKPKPLEVELRCDVALVDGGSFNEIEWAITEYEQEGKTELKVIAKGDFSQGPTLKVIHQKAVLPNPTHLPLMLAWKEFV